MPVLRIVLASFLLLGLAAAGELRTLSGKKLAGDLVSFDGKNLVLQADGESVTIPAADLLHLELSPPVSLTGLKYYDVELTDGSLLHCSQVTLQKAEVHLVLLPNLRLRVPLSAVRSILSEAHDPKNRQQWQEFVGRQKGNSDVLAIQRDGVLNGLEGTFGPADDKGETIEFKLTSGRVFQPALARIHGMILFHRPQENRPETVCRVHDTHRNYLNAAALAVVEDKVAVTTVAGVRVEYPNRLALSRLDFSKGRREYLSDLEPILLEVSSSEERIDKYRRDKNLDDGPIRLAGKTTNELARPTYAKGLVLLANTVIVYELGGEYKEFKAILGVDAQSGADSQVKLTIDGDGRQLYAGEVKRPDDPRSITLDIKGVKQLRISVTAELLDLGNHVVLADAQVSK